MKVNFSQLTPSGPVKFTGDLTDDEVMWLVEYAVLDLIRRGVVNFPIRQEPIESTTLIPGSPTCQ